MVESAKEIAWMEDERASADLTKSEGRLCKRWVNHRMPYGRVGDVP